MDKNGIGSNQQKTCCEKVYAAVRNTSPLIRTIRFTKQQHPANHTPASSAKVSLMTPTPLRDRCVRVSRVETSPNVSSTNTNHCPRVSKQPVRHSAAETKTKAEKVAVTQDHKGNHSHVSSPNINQAKPNATVLPVDGHENKFPTHIGGPNSCIAQSINGMSSAYIDSAGKRIRATSNVGARKPSIKRDSFNDRITNFIDVTKNKFHNAISFNEGSEGKEKRLK